MVERLEALGREIPWRADGLEHDIVVFAAHGHAVDDDVADLAQQAVELGPGLVGVASSDLTCSLSFAACVRASWATFSRCSASGRSGLLGLLEGAHRGTDRLADGLLLGAQRLELAEGGSTALVGSEDRVHDPRVLSTGLLRGADSVGFVAHELDVDHAGQPIRAPTRPTTEILRVYSFLRRGSRRSHPRERERGGGRPGAALQRRRFRGGSKADPDHLPGVRRDAARRDVRLVAAEREPVGRGQPSDDDVGRGRSGSDTHAGRRWVR